MADKGNTAASGGFKLPKWGPKKLRDIFELIQNRINEITLEGGIGIEVDGRQINVTTTPAGKSGTTAAGVIGGSGTPVDVYGALNGARATYHLLQSSPPTPNP